VKIYTKTGDKGKTSLLGGKRVSKTNLRIETYGTIDELSSVIGICRAYNPPKKVDTFLNKVQEHLFIIGAELAINATSPHKYLTTQIQKEDITFLEKCIDEIEFLNKPLRNFILPGGSLLGANIHFARTVCRRAERLVVKLSIGSKINKNIIIYLNRLSDFLFVLARWVNRLENFEEKKTGLKI